MSMNDLDKSHFKALLNGVSNKVFFNEKRVTLAEDIFDSITDHETLQNQQVQQQIIDNLTDIYQQFLYNLSFSPAQLKEIVENTINLKEEYITILIQHYQKLQPKLKYTISKNSQWNNQLSSFQWRIDLNKEPKAVIQMKTIQQQQNQPQVITFDINHQDIHEKLIQPIQHIEETIKQFQQQ